jgi:hypothetical protein
MTSEHVIETGTGEWLAAYSPVGSVVHFTRDLNEARRVCMDYPPSRDWARQALDVAKNVYQRKNARIVREPVTVFRAT